MKNIKKGMVINILSEMPCEVACSCITHNTNNNNNNLRGYRYCIR